MPSALGFAVSLGMSKAASATSKSASFPLNRAGRPLRTILRGDHGDVPVLGDISRKGLPARFNGQDADFLVAEVAFECWATPRNLTRMAWTLPRTNRIVWGVVFCL